MQQQQKTITLKVSDKTKEQMLEFFEDLKREKTPPYAIFQAQDGDTVITLYESGKAVFQGKDADLSSDFWIATEKINSGSATTTDSRDKKKEDKPNKILPIRINSIGSDEVGTGDYFGPIVVTASYVSKENIDFLLELKVKDSKNLTDEDYKILDIIKDKKAIILLNKVDLNSVLDENDNLFKDITDNIIKISALNGEGIEKLYYLISFT